MIRPYTCTASGTPHPAGQHIVTKRLLAAVRMRSHHAHVVASIYPVCVLDSQHALAAAGLGEDEVEQRGPGSAQMQVARGAGREPHPNHRSLPTRSN